MYSFKNFGELTGREAGRTPTDRGVQGLWLVLLDDIDFLSSSK
jgi:hypothetical protein